MKARRRFAQSHVEFAMAEQTHRFLFGKAVRMTRIAARSQIRSIGARWAWYFNERKRQVGKVQDILLG